MLRETQVDIVLSGCMARHCYVVAQQKPSLKLNLTRSNCCLVVEQLHHSVESSFFFLTFSSHTGCMSRESDFNHNRRTPFPPRSRPKARRGKLGRKRRALFPQYKYGMRRASPDPLPQYRTQSGECARRPQLLEHITSEEILRERVPFPFPHSRRLPTMVTLQRSSRAFPSSFRIAVSRHTGRNDCIILSGARCKCAGEANKSSVEIDALRRGGGFSLALRQYRLHALLRGSTCRSHNVLWWGWWR
jgi:hypothetical protein